MLWKWYVGGEMIQKARDTREKMFCDLFIYYILKYLYPACPLSSPKKLAKDVAGINNNGLNSQL